MRRRLCSAIYLTGPELPGVAQAILELRQLPVDFIIRPGGHGEDGTYETWTPKLQAKVNEIFETLGRNAVVSLDDSIGPLAFGPGNHVLEHVNMVWSRDPSRITTSRTLLDFAVRARKLGEKLYMLYPADSLQRYWEPLLNVALKAINEAVELDRKAGFSGRGRSKDDKPINLAATQTLVDALMAVSASARPDYRGPKYTDRLIDLETFESFGLVQIRGIETP